MTLACVTDTQEVSFWRFFIFSPKTHKHNKKVHRLKAGAKLMYHLA